MKRYVYEAILTPAEEGGYTVSVPDLPGCFTEGDDYAEAVEMAADAMKTYVALLLLNGTNPPKVEHYDCPEGCILVAVSFETDEGYIVEGEVVSAAEASRRLGVTPGRVTHMLDAGVLDGYRKGRRTYITVASIKARLADKPGAGRPRREKVGA